MLAAKQLGMQIREARENASISGRALSRSVGVSAPTIAEYEAGNSMPDADTLVKIAHTLGIHTFEINEYRFTITRKEKLSPVPATEQLALDFVGEYAFSKAFVRLSPGRVSISFDGATPIPERQVS